MKKINLVFLLIFIILLTSCDQEFQNNQVSTDSNKKYDIQLSLSDDKPWAQATVIISYSK